MTIKLTDSSGTVVRSFAVPLDSPLGRDLEANKRWPEVISIEHDGPETCGWTFYSLIDWNGAIDAEYSESSGWFIAANDPLLAP